MEGQLLLNVVVRNSAAALKLLSSEDKMPLVRRDTLLVIFTLLMVSEDVTSRVVVFPVRVLTKICIPPQRQRTRWRVDSFWTLESERVCLSSSCLLANMSTAGLGKSCPACQ